MSKKQRRYKFLAERQDSADSMKPVNVRIPADLHSKFTEAKSVAEKHGFTLVMSDIVRGAIEDACDEVEKAFKVELQQQDLPLGKPEVKQSVKPQSGK